jgi:hypothetical protein
MRVSQAAIRFSTDTKSVDGAQVKHLRKSAGSKIFMQSSLSQWVVVRVRSVQQLDMSQSVALAEAVV